MTAPSADQRQQAFEQSVATSLHLWPALTLAVQSGWGGPDSTDKRDWFAGVLVDAFPAIPAHLATLSRKRQSPNSKPLDDADDDVPDDEYIEIMLLQVMQDEFEVTVEDGSAAEVAAAIVRLWTRCLVGDLAEAEAVVRRWQGLKGAAAPAGLFTRGTDPNQEVEGDDWEDDDDDDDDDDDEMGEAPALVEAPKEKPPPEVDEDGFTKVTRRKR